MNLITLVPLGDADRRLVADLGGPLAEKFGGRVSIHGAGTDISPFLDDTRFQYDSTKVLRHLAGKWKENGWEAIGGRGKILAVASEDLFIPILTFVFGEAVLGGDAAVVSYHRLQNERYGLPEDHGLLFQRLVKESIHEMGHTFGLIHCMSDTCVMRSSTDVEEIDMKGVSFCPQCGEELAAKMM